MSPLVWHRPSLWITHKEIGTLPTTLAQCGLVGANDCKCTRPRVVKPLVPGVFSVVSSHQPALSPRGGLWPVLLMLKFTISSSRCFGTHFKPLVSVAFSVVITHQSALGTRSGLWPVLLMCNS
jgi:hypothetical protein